MPSASLLQPLLSIFWAQASAEFRALPRASPRPLPRSSNCAEVNCGAVKLMRRRRLAERKRNGGGGGGGRPSRADVLVGGAVFSELLVNLGGQHADRALALGVLLQLAADAADVALQRAADGLVVAGGGGVQLATGHIDALRLAAGLADLPGAGDDVARHVVHCALNRPLSGFAHFVQVELGGGGPRGAGKEKEEKEEEEEKGTAPWQSRSIEPTLVHYNKRTLVKIAVAVVRVRVNNSSNRKVSEGFPAAPHLMAPKGAHRSSRRSLCVRWWLYSELWHCGSVAASDRLMQALLIIERQQASTVSFLIASSVVPSGVQLTWNWLNFPRQLPSSTG
ncbi:hypothetical protein TYRP_003132 [Tyrophagus putrescentiae]|nr:hypothetical protein TYRP_003132 [Tyrophagus putrescentiae]